MQKLIRTTILTGYVLLSTGCAVHVHANDGARMGDLDTVFGGIDVGKNAKVGDVSSVNGGIDIDSGASAGEVDTVNGGIELGDNVTIESAETVNGGINAGESLKVKYDVETVNGGIYLRAKTVVEGNVETVNGDIQLVNTLINKNVETVNGDITLRNQTTLKGDLVIEKSGGWFSSMSQDEITIKIDATSSVEGTIHLHRPVTLEIAEQAKVGKIEKHYSQK